MFGERARLGRWRVHLVIASLVLTVIIVCAFECTFALQRPQIGKLENRIEGSSRESKNRER